MSSLNGKEYLPELNAAQKEAVCFAGNQPVLVLAGPGSGKTHVITRRIRYLLEEKQVSPEKILVLTFTRDAARSMQQRFEQDHQNSKTVNFGTFHSVFYQILKQSTPLRDSQMLTDGDKRKLLMPILNAHFPQTNFSQRNNLCMDFLSAISLYKNTKNEQVATRYFTEDIKECFCSVFDQYEIERARVGKLDFDDMLGDCQRLLSQNESVRAYWQQRFSHLLIDEFQDSNPAQYEVIRLLAPPPFAVFAVGDDDQSIYGFRGSDPDCMKQFERDYQPRKVILNVNYRSTPEIVRASLRVIEDNKNRFVKKYVSFSEPGMDISNKEKSNKEKPNGEKQAKENHPVKRSRDIQVMKFVDRMDECSFLEKTILENGECAVLFRTNRLMHRFAAELEKKEIPYEMREKSQNPYDEEVSQDIMAYLRIANGERDLGLWSRVINKPLRYVSREALTACHGLQLSPTEVLEKLQNYYVSRDMRVWDALQVMKKQLKTLSQLSLFPAIAYIRKVIGYENYLKETSKEFSGHMAEKMETLHWLSENSLEFRDLEEWLDFQKNMGTRNHKKKEGTTAKTENTKEYKDKIHLMTVHGSKGLEFDTVFMPDCNERIYPYGHLLSEKDVEEERRLFYVGMTRARKKLFLLYLAGTKDYPEQPSRFLKHLC